MDAFSISIILSIFAYSMSVWLGKKNPVRAASLTAGMTILLLLAPLLLALPKWHVETDWFTVTPSANSTTEEAHWHSIAHFIWSLGAVVCFTRYLKGAMTTRKWISQSTQADAGDARELLSSATLEVGLKKRPQLRYSSTISSPAVIGLLHPTILLPENASGWDSSTLRMVLLHELGHIRRRDLWVSHAAQLNCILHWCNPFVWLLHTKLRNQCEFAVDAKIIEGGTDVQCYVSALCNVAETLIPQKTLPNGALAMADKASLRNRVNNLANTRASSSPLVVALLLGCTISSTLALAVVRPQASLTTPSQPHFPTPVYSAQEIELRLSASPFPDDR